jgi:hypothetical protein
MFVGCDIIPWAIMPLQVATIAAQHDLYRPELLATPQLNTIKNIIEVSLHITYHSLHHLSQLTMMNLIGSWNFRLYPTHNLVTIHKCCEWIGIVHTCSLASFWTYYVSCNHVTIFYKGQL